MLRAVATLPLLASVLGLGLGLAACDSSSAPSAGTSPHAATTVASPSAPVSEGPSKAPKHHEADHDPRWRFYTADKHWYSSPWFGGVHRIMIGFGCNASPWYDHDPRCPGSEGFHHGIDVAMPCGTPILAGLGGTELSPSAPGAPGAAYGINPVRLRITGPGGPHDVVIGHTRQVFVQPGDHVDPGQRLAFASDSGAPDGCHLHFEVRPPGGSYTTAVDPARWLSLQRA